MSYRGHTCRRTRRPISRGSEGCEHHLLQTGEPLQQVFDVLTLRRCPNIARFRKPLQHRPLGGRGSAAQVQGHAACSNTDRYPLRGLPAVRARRHSDTTTSPFTPRGLYPPRVDGIHRHRKGPSPPAQASRRPLSTRTHLGPPRPATRRVARTAWPAKHVRGRRAGGGGCGLALTSVSTTCVNAWADAYRMYAAYMYYAS